LIVFQHVNKKKLCNAVKAVFTHTATVLTIVFQRVNKKNATIFEFEAAFFLRPFRTASKRRLALSNSFSASWTFFISALPSSIPAHLRQRC